MNAKVLIAAVAGLVGLAASADVLYWQVNNANADAGAKGGTEYSYALLRATDGEGQYYVNQNLNPSGVDVGAAVGRSFFADGGYVGGVLEASQILSMADGSTSYAGGVSDLSFFIELYDSSGNWLAETSSKTYTQLQELGTISGFDANFKGVNAALGSAVNGSYQIPEPTSGLLMLVGLGALALRRRKVA